jgi:hypothetical protein
VFVKLKAVFPPPSKSSIKAALAGWPARQQKVINATAPRGIRLFVLIASITSKKMLLKKGPQCIQHDVSRMRTADACVIYTAMGLKRLLNAIMASHNRGLPEGKRKLCKRLILGSVNALYQAVRVTSWPSKRKVKMIKVVLISNPQKANP